MSHINEGVVEVSIISQQEDLTIVELHLGAGEEEDGVKSRFSCNSMDHTEIEPGDFVLVSLTVTGKSIRKQDFFDVLMEYEEETNQILLKYVHQVYPSGKCCMWSAKDILGIHVSDPEKSET